MKRLLFIPALIIYSTTTALAQPKAPLNWYLKSPKEDGIYGTAAEEAYRLLQGRKSVPVIVGVIDSGVETDHPDLKEVIWVNKGEVPGNGKDDDHNGYIDDVHGWSFLGGKVEDIGDEASELKRLVFIERAYFQGKDTTKLSGADSERFAKYKKLRSTYDSEVMQTQMSYQNVKLLSDYINNVKNQTGAPFSKETNKKYVPTNAMEERIKKRMGVILLAYSPEQLEAELASAKSSMEGQMKMANVDADSLRRAVVGDNPLDLSNRYYGCNRYEGPDAMHGTHVSGIIGASRGNGVGIDGIAANVQIMVLRAVPNGDERDKDVANAIRYAVDNGAKVINMSFGKYYVLHKEYVDEAIQYALDHDVLLIHAAGNESKNKDIETSFPTLKANSGATFANWIEVGASSSSKSSKKIIAEFSNYGATTVDFFAPGVDIYSTVPDAKYEDASGTSMACPATAGVAALIRSYFPNLSAVEVKDLLMKTTTPYKKNVIIPGTKKKAKLTEISITGGFLNAAEAVKFLLKKG
jgi:subtilisin family serine protease